MEVNTALISTEEYNRLRDFKNNILKKNAVEIHYAYSLDPHLYVQTIYTQNEAVEIIAHKNKVLSDEITRLKENMAGLNNPKSAVKTLADFESMSIFGFIKYILSKK
jgi:hypothetical protein